MHHLVGHQHANDFHCDANGTAKHFHEAEQTLEDCFICGFNFAPTENCDSGITPLIDLTFLSGKCFSHHLILPAAKEILPDLRAPPLV